MRRQQYRLGAMLLGTTAILLCAALARPQGFSGYAEVKGFAYFERANDSDAWVEGWSTLLLKGEKRVGLAQLTAAARAEWIPADERGSLTLDPADRDFRRSPISVRELWVRYPLARSLDLKLGRFQLGWGKTDGYSPADAFLPRDLSDPFADEKLPLWGARLTGQRGWFRFEAFGAATTTPWRLPDLDSRNAPLETNAPVDDVILVDGHGTPPEAGFGALRLLGTLGAWDLGMWGRAGNRPAPLLVFRVDQARATDDGLVVPVDRRYVREHGLGLELSRVTGAWVLRGELGALFSDDAELGDAVIWTLSAERWFGDGNLLLTVADNARDTPVDPLLLVDRTILPAVIAAWNRTEEWGNWRAVWTIGLDHGDGLVEAEAAYNVTDEWKATLGFDLPYGSKEGGLGGLYAARRVYAALRRSW